MIKTECFKLSKQKLEETQQNAMRCWTYSCSQLENVGRNIENLWISIPVRYKIVKEYDAALMFMVSHQMQVSDAEMA